MTSTAVRNRVGGPTQSGTTVETTRRTKGGCKLDVGWRMPGVEVAPRGPRMPGAPIIMTRPSMIVVAAIEAPVTVPWTMTRSPTEMSETEAVVVAEPLMTFAFEASTLYVVEAVVVPWRPRTVIVSPSTAVTVPNTPFLIAIMPLAPMCIPPVVVASQWEPFAGGVMDGIEACPPNMPEKNMPTEAKNVEKWNIVLIDS